MAARQSLLKLRLLETDLRQAQLLALLSAQFPEIGRTVLKWIEPVQKAIP